MANHKIIFSDNRCMKHLEDGSVQLVIAFLPDAVGKDALQYSDNISEVLRECIRVLSDGCRICVGVEERPFFNRGKYSVVSVKSEIINLFYDNSCDYMGSIIRQTAPTGGGIVLGSYPYPRNGVLKINYDYILIFRKSGTQPKPTEEQKKLSAMTSEQWHSYFLPIWNLEAERRREETIKRLIKMYSFAGETVLDPFLRDGTTSVCAKELGRFSVGYENDRNSFSEMKRRLNADQLTLWGDEFEFIFD